MPLINNDLYKMLKDILNTLSATKAEITTANENTRMSLKSISDGVQSIDNKTPRK